MRLSGKIRENHYRDKIIRTDRESHGHGKETLGKEREIKREEQVSSESCKRNSEKNLKKM